jgi:hypothetical protein
MRSRAFKLGVTIEMSGACGSMAERYVSDCGVG